MRTRLVAAWIVLCLSGLACAPEANAPGALAGDFAVRFTVVNELLAPVTIAVDDTVTLILTGGRSAGLAVSPRAHWLTWTSAKAADTIGRAIPDDIRPQRVSIFGIHGTLEITNVINDTTYVTAEFYNHTSARVAIGVYDGTTVSCVGVLRAMTGVVNGFTRIGYYRLLPMTEIRAYREGATCVGDYAVWPNARLRVFVPKSGLVSLDLTTPP